MKQIFEETRIGSMALKNRLVRSATYENMAGDQGYMTDKLFKVYEDLARGGVGLMITGYAFVTSDEQPNPSMMGIYDDSFIANYRDLTDMVHQHDSRIVMQIAYGGTQTGYRPEGRVIWGPSSVADLAYGVVPTPMSKENIRTLVQAFGNAAARVKAAGFDGVQIHGAHGYLLSQFLTPHYNHRTENMAVASRTDPVSSWRSMMKSGAWSAATSPFCSSLMPRISWRMDSLLKIHAMWRIYLPNWGSMRWKSAGARLPRGRKIPAA